MYEETHELQTEEPISVPFSSSRSFLVFRRHFHIEKIAIYKFDIPVNLDSGPIVMVKAHSSGPFLSVAFIHYSLFTGATVALQRSNDLSRVFLALVLPTQGLGASCLVVYPSQRNESQYT